MTVKIGCFSLFSGMRSEGSQLYDDGMGFPVAVQFKSILPPALRVTVSFSGWVKFGGSEDMNKIQIQTETGK